MFCQKCGRELGENEKFCGGCGTPVNAQAAQDTPTEIIAEPTPKPQEKKRYRKSIVPIIIGVILLAAIVAVVVLMRFDFGETDSVTAMLETAQKYLVELNYEQAIAEFNKVIEVDPINVDAYLGLAEAYERSGDTEKAIEVLEKGFELTGDERIAARVAEIRGENELVTTSVTEVTTELTEETETNSDWSETSFSGKMYIARDCHSREEPATDAGRVTEYSIGDEVEIVAVTDSGYYKLSDGGYVHPKWVSESITGAVRERILKDAYPDEWFKYEENYWYYTDSEFIVALVNSNTEVVVIEGNNTVTTLYTGDYRLYAPQLISMDDGTVLFEVNYGVDASLSGVGMTYSETSNSSVMPLGMYTLAPIPENTYSVLFLLDSEDSHLIDIYYSLCYMGEKIFYATYYPSDSFIDKTTYCYRYENGTLVLYDTIQFERAPGMKSNP